MNFRTRLSLYLCYLERTWFYLALAATFAVGWYYPPAGAWMKRVDATTYLVIFAFLLNGLTLSTTSLVGNLRQWRVMVTAMLITFAVSPVLIYLVRQFVPGTETPLSIGYQLLSVVPTTLVSAVVLTRVAGGNGAIALYVTVLANILAVFVVPLLMRVTLGAAGAHLDILHTSLSLAETVILPTLVGQVLRIWVQGWVTRHLRLLGGISQFTILLFIITGLYALPREGISPHVWWAVFVIGAAFHLGLLGIANSAGRLLRVDSPTLTALTLCTAQKSLIISVFLFERLITPLGPTFGIAILPGIAYYVVELVMDSMLAQWWGRGMAREGVPSCDMRMLEG